MFIEKRYQGSIRAIKRNLIIDFFLYELCIDYTGIMIQYAVNQLEKQMLFYVTYGIMKIVETQTLQIMRDQLQDWSSKN